MRRFYCIALTLLVLLLPGCATNPSTGRNQLLLVSSEQTLQMGVQAKPGLIKEYGGEYPSAPLQTYVDDVGGRLLNHIEREYTELPWEFVLLDSDVINAFALPGGKVFLTVGMLSKLSNEAQVAGVIGHEIGHVTARHVDERISHAMAMELGLSVLDVSTETGTATAVAALFGNGYLLRFGRDQELEADRQGMKYLSRAMYDPIGMRQVLEVLRDNSGSSRMLEFLSTHPHPERRLAQADQLLTGRYAETQNNPAYQTYRDRFDRDVRPNLPDLRANVSGAIDPTDYCLVCRPSSYSTPGIELRNRTLNR